MAIALEIKKRRVGIDKNLKRDENWMMPTAYNDMVMGVVGGQ